MRRLRLKKRYKFKEKFKVRERSRSSLTPEEQIKAIANIVIDRIFEEAQRGNLPFQIPNYGQSDQD